jgi:endonuclease/exonuclease/phosphatase family metal-dependent hydrolase
MRPARALVLIVSLGIAAGACSHSAAAPVTLLTVNIASGAGDAYRTADNRARQAAFVADSGAAIVGMEEVDVDVQRSFGADTGDDLLGLPCTVADPPFSPDGVRRCDGPTGTYVFGLALRGDDMYENLNGVPLGIFDDEGRVDRSHDATYGVALGVRGLAVSDAYAVGLPTAIDQPADDPLYTALAASPPSSPARAELAARNLYLRTQPAHEPRIALVTRIDRGEAPPLTVIETHLEVATFADISANQLARVLVIAKAERAGPPARRVVVMGDLNKATLGHEGDLMAAGLRRALASAVSGGDPQDQIWVDDDLLIRDSAELPTDGVTDHEVAVRATIK